jgi:SAM-dependent methyltransferase
MVSDALSVSTRGAAAATARGTTSGNGVFPPRHDGMLALRTRQRQGSSGMEPGEYALMDAAEDHMWWYRALHRRLIDALAGVRGTVLDAGCGTGGFLVRLRAARPELRSVGVEWSGQAAGRASAKSAAPVVRGSLNALPFAHATFDAAVSADVLCHREIDPPLALAELRRVLRPGGRLVINMPAYAWLLAAHDRQVHNVRRCTARELRDMLRDAGFLGVRARYWNGLLLPLMIAQRKLLTPRAATSDVASFPPWLDAMFHAMTECERRLPFRLPAGGSVMASAERL